MIMLIGVHVVAAVMSLAFMSVLFFKPSDAAFKFNYGLIGITLLSGIILVISRQAELLSTCITGLFYLSVVSLGLLAAHYKYARDTIDTRHRQ